MLVRRGNLQSLILWNIIDCISGSILEPTLLRYLGGKAERRLAGALRSLCHRHHLVLHRKLKGDFVEFSISKDRNSIRPDCIYRMEINSQLITRQLKTKGGFSIDQNGILLDSLLQLNILDRDLNHY